MSIRTRAVRVQQFPETITATRQQTFLRELRKYAQSQRPRLVLDCSKVKELDKVTLQLLLCCLEEVLKGNGDVRLASLCADAESALRVAGANRLFEVYATSEAAVNSFHLRPTSMGLQPLTEEGVGIGAEHAA